MNSLKQLLAAALDTKTGEIESRVSSIAAAGQPEDITLPGAPFASGRIHPVSQVADEVKGIFSKLGFSVESVPDIEGCRKNFTAFDIEEVKDAFDAFSVQGREADSECQFTLRTHIFPALARVMEKRKPPVMAIASGRVYRPGAVDTSNSYIFHQVAGLAVDEGITFADIRAMLGIFVKMVFGNDVQSRFRPVYCPFTKPSAAIDVRCSICGGSGCGVCKQSGWVEILGCGMISPKVLESAGYDPKKYAGYAFSIGIERLALLKFGINDIRVFFENDVRFLEQF
jgi:phenylalanyl-tRNA synthetase alpha chain